MVSKHKLLFMSLSSPLKIKEKAFDEDGLLIQKPWFGKFKKFIVPQQASSKTSDIFSLNTINLNFGFEKGMGRQS